MDTFECISSVCGAYGSVKQATQAGQHRKHKHGKSLGTFGSVLERLEAFGKRLDAIRALWERIRALGRLRRLVSIKYGMVWC